MTSSVAPVRSAKVTLCLSFALIFLCGAVSGALLMNLSTHIRHKADVTSGRGHFEKKFELQHLKKELDLSDE
jgi:hypothetical protein